VKIKIFTTGGSIDKRYSTTESDLVVGLPQIERILREGNVTCDCEIEPLLQKDSLDVTADDRRRIVERVRATPHRLVVITHGTDTMVDTARALASIPDKVIVLTGAMQPAAFKETDAPFNVGCAIAAVQLLPEGVYLAMNGRIFDPQTVRKDAARDRFVETG
jgi:L-asparaginase